MTLTPKILDPVQGLIDYVLTIKPYHTKIIEVLEELIHTDYLYVNMSDKINFCINFGIPNLNTMFAYDIIDISLSNNSITVNNSVDSLIYIGQRISIEFSNHNNGHYYVKLITYDEINNITEIELENNLISNDIDGKIVNSVIEYCPESNIKSVNVFDLQEISCTGGFGEIYDSFVSIVLQINTLDTSSENSIIISGNQLSKLEKTTTISLIDESLYPNDTFGTFHIESYSYNGVDTLVNLIEPIHLFPNYNPSITYKVLISYIGFDTVISCDLKNDSDNSETLFVSMTEEFNFELSMNYTDNFKVYNMENSYETSFDNIKFGIIDSQIEPIITESLIQPINPNLFDLWFDLNIEQLRQWQNYKWVKITHAYWYKEDILNPQIATYYKIVKDQFNDTGWIEIDPTLNDNIGLGYDLENYSTERNTYFHSENQLEIDQSLNGLFLTGGNFTSLLLNNISIKTYDNVSYLSNISHTIFVIKSKSNNEIILNDSHGDLSDLFINGISFIIELPELKNKEFNVISSLYDGVNTIITISENLDTYNFNVDSNGIIPGIFYVQPNTFNLNHTSTLFILDNTINPTIKSIEYVYNGPLRLDTNLFRNDEIEYDLIESGFSNDLFISPNNSITGDIAQTSITDEITWDWGNIEQWFQYYVIGILNLNTFIVSGNATIDIQVNQKFRIIGLNNNVGIYTADSIIFDGINTIITILELLEDVNFASTYIEPEDSLPIRILLSDTIGVNLSELTDGSILSTSGNLVQAFDYKYFDIGGYDNQI